MLERIHRIILDKTTKTDKDHILHWVLGHRGDLDLLWGHSVGNVRTKVKKGTPEDRSHQASLRGTFGRCSFKVAIFHTFSSFISIKLPYLWKRLVEADPLMLFCDALNLVSVLLTENPRLLSRLRPRPVLFFPPHICHFVASQTAMSLAHWGQIKGLSLSAVILYH